MGGNKGSLTGQAIAACTKSKIKNSVTTSCQLAEDWLLPGSLWAQYYLEDKYYDQKCLSILLS